MKSLIHRTLMGMAAGASLASFVVPASAAEPVTEDIYTEELPAQVFFDEGENAKFTERFGKLVDEGKAFTTTALLKDVGKAGSEKVPASQLAQVDADSKDLALPDLYDQSVDSVLMIASLYNCGRCDNWHVGAIATAWAANEDGIVVTNYHVLEGKGEEHFLGVMTRSGKVYPVVEVLAGDKAADVAFIKVDTSGEKLQPLALGASARVGEDVTVISNPQRRKWVMTHGIVSRYFLNKISPQAGFVTRMSITAEYAVGSSGGPLLNNKGEVIGMVCSTQPVFARNDNQPKDTPGTVQMVYKDSVPVVAIRALVDETK
ncbi:S1 family peptidase [Sulfuriroseicoccus oceanibius]|uniref:Trypsin-like peptidase domain-containing protein n=1 Tax=Sulfuriroseicoccus oceanibius TaxID=2707525 RepID=A0A6B3L6K5_9BACT|nr:serine protease [Sulfuriroseicoccus oceanibius]QQL43692.1 trypsin-like peptidase domain-containing protein [Sulfuriroseicoccus oceanibius]